MNHEFDYDNADRKDLLERCKSFEIAVDAQHTLIMSTSNELYQLRELCGELLDALKYHRELTRPIHQSDLAITKAEKVLGGSDGNS